MRQRPPHPHVGNREVSSNAPPSNGIPSWWRTLLCAPSQPTSHGTRTRSMPSPSWWCSSTSTSSGPLGQPGDLDAAFHLDSEVLQAPRQQSFHVGLRQHQQVGVRGVQLAQVQPQEPLVLAENLELGDRDTAGPRRVG